MRNQRQPPSERSVVHYSCPLPSVLDLSVDVAGYTGASHNTLVTAALAVSRTKGEAVTVNHTTQITPLFS